MSFILRLKKIDRVSMYDLLRNGFIHPPYSIYSDFNIMTLGFSSDGPQKKLNHKFPFSNSYKLSKTKDHSNYINKYERSSTKL